MPTSLRKSVVSGGVEWSRSGIIVQESAVRIALLALHFAEYASRLALALSASHEVLLVLRTSNAGHELSDDLRAELARSVSVRFIELSRLRSPRTLVVHAEINRMVRDFSPDVLHLHEIHPAWTGWTILSFRRRIPLVITVHDHVPHSGGKSRDTWHWKAVQWVRRGAHRLIVHGPRIQGELHEVNGGITGRTDVIHHGILGRSGVEEDISSYEPGTFLFFGRILAYKGLRYLLDAGELLHERGHAFRLIVAGTGKDLELHRRRIEQAAWVELIDRYIPVSEVPALFRRAMSVVLPYTDATQSGVSAMAFGFSRPVIATPVGDVPEVVIDGQTGLITPPRDGNALADAMEKLLVDRALRESLASGAGRFARENLTWPRIAESTCDTYRRAMRSL
jgi:glycosyltransferase involved in cell wall biosynthesis